jgi:hypothetical protein
VNLWKEYKVSLQFTNEIMGGTPKSPELIWDWLEARKAPDPEKNAEEIEAGIDASEDRSWSGFQRQDGVGLCLRGYHVKAHIKDCANILRAMLPKRGKADGTEVAMAWRSMVADRCYVVEDYIPLGAKEPSGFFEHPVHVMTRQGPRNALKRTDYVDKPTITFTLKLLADKVVTEEVLRQLFEYGGTHGMGSDRGMGFGRYEVAELTEMA